MPDGTMTLENYIPESAKMMRSIQTPQENIDKFGKDAPKMLLDKNVSELTEEQIMELRYQRGEGGPNPELEIATSENLGIVTDAVHMVCEIYENDDFLPSQDSPYGHIQATTTILERRLIALDYTNKQLKEFGWAEIDENGYGNPLTDRKGYYLGLRSAPIQIGKQRLEIKVPYYGKTEEERTDLRNRISELRGMLYARKSITEEKIFTNRNIENSTGLATKYFHDQISHLGLKELFGAPASIDSPKETTTRHEYEKGHEFGEMFQFDHQLLTVVAMSCRPRELRKLREKNGKITKGWKMLFPESTDGEDGISEAEKLWVGNVYKMESKMQIFENPHTHKKRELEIVDKSTINSEKGNGTRGLLTSDIDAITETEPETQDRIRNRIKVFLGGGIPLSSEDELLNLSQPRENRTVRAAEDLGWDTFKLWDVSSSLGWRMAKFETQTPLKKGDPDFKYDEELMKNRLGQTEYSGFYGVGDFGGDVSLDTMKVTMPWLFQLMYYAKGREAGPLGPAMFSYDSFITDLTRTITFKGEDKKPYTLFEATWYGIPTRNHPEGTTLIHEMPWSQVGKRILTKAYLPEFMGLREQVGIFGQATGMSLKLEALTNEEELFKMWKMVSLMVTKNAVAEGVLHDKDPNELAFQTDQRRMETMNSIIAGIEYYTQYDNDINGKMGEGNISSPAFLFQGINKAIDRFNVRCGQVPGYPERKLNKLKTPSKLAFGDNKSSR